ncbi:hypothetical protein G9C85_15780 [Halorubellus sp. JP-L1]|uniref:hypothetical protein n=1 Tax=Halorubellus sp. JP-L1 TaxID=2715753 RepID=UPI001407AC6A|nr:hypothetical protein [Halorubellus sp. JP-L1]NHN43077.1 hypothetical protein [Halorubellus sp. JP-L1]
MGGQSDDRASAVTVGLVFVGLAIVTALLAGSFWILATSDGGGGDPTQLAVDSSRCTVGADGNATGIETVTLSMRYRGNGTVDLADAAVRYGDETTERRLAIADEPGESAVGVRNGSGAFDPTIERGTSLTVVVDVSSVRGGPLEAGQRASIDLVVDDATVASTSVRAPGGLSESESFVAC